MAGGDADDSCPGVTIDSSALGDTRLDYLGELAGFNRYEALGRVLNFMHTLAERQTDTITTEYANAIMGGSAGVNALVEAGFAQVVSQGVRQRELLRSAPEPKRLPSPLWITYAIRASAVGLVKIGRTVDIERRLSALQCGSPVTLDLAGIISGDRELEMHTKFSALRVHGEWFTPCREMMEIFTVES